MALVEGLGSSGYFSYILKCDHCGHTPLVANNVASSLIDWAKAHGWNMTNLNFMLCPECAAKHPVRKALAFICDTRNREYQEQGIECGAANGYVAVPPEHLMAGMGYDAVMETFGYAPCGELTFARPFREACKMADFRPVEKGAASPNDLQSRWWVIGFDTMHFGQTRENMPVERVVEDANLLRQWCDLIGMGEATRPEIFRLQDAGVCRVASELSSYNGEKKQFGYSLSTGGRTQWVGDAEDPEQKLTLTILEKGGSDD